MTHVTCRLTAKNRDQLRKLGIVELCAKILQIMRNDFKDYARTFCQLCAPFFNSNFNQSITEIEILCQHVNNDISSELLA